MSDTAQTELGSVVSPWRYPVKSMMGEELNATEVTERGLLGDRAYALRRYATNYRYKSRRDGNECHGIALTREENEDLQTAVMAQID